MPDHGHFLWVGLDDDSDQHLAAAWFRKQWNSLLAPQRSLQRQSYDHILREPNTTPNAFAKIAHYILANPERAGLVPHWSAWPYLGAMFPGVRPFDPRMPDHWDRFWREHHRRLVPPLPQPVSHPPLTHATDLNNKM
jgi:hypothetical protein